MYAVVGCDECSALWIVEGRPGTSQCPRCGKTRSYDKRRQFVTTDDEDHAREVRASMLAARGGYGDEFAELDSFAELESQLDDAGIDEETYLAESGVDPDVVTSKQTEDAGGKQSNKAVLREALRTLEEPTEPDVVAYARARDVQPEYTRNALDDLVRAGHATEQGGVYRLL